MENRQSSQPMSSCWRNNVKLPPHKAGRPLAYFRKSMFAPLTIRTKAFKTLQIRNYCLHPFWGGRWCWLRARCGRKMLNV